MLSYPSSISLSTRSLNHLADLIRSRRKTLRSRWRRLSPGRQALLALAHLRNGDTPTRLAAGFEVGATTAWRYIREAVDLLAATDLRNSEPEPLAALAGFLREHGREEEAAVLDERIEALLQPERAARII